MNVLSHLEPKNVFRFFEDLCAIPHGSGNTKEISDWCAAFARERGLDFRFTPCTAETEVHPNTVDIRMENAAGQTMVVRGESLGGGKVRIVRINGVEVDFTGAYSTVIVVQQDKPGVVAHITKVLSDNGVNIAFMRLFREAKGHTAYTIVESDGRLPEGIAEPLRDNPNVQDVMLLEP